MPLNGQTYPTCIDRVTTIWAGPFVKSGFLSNQGYSHYSFVTTLENLWGLSPPLTPPSVNAPLMLEFFNPNDGSVGGTVIPVNKLDLLLPNIAFVTIVALVSTGAILSLKRCLSRTRHSLLPG